MSQIAMVWVEDGCITCDACQEIAPDVFEVQDDSSFIVAAARVDGGFDSNESTKSALKDEIGSSMYDDILDAVDGCPVEVIKYVEVGAEPTGGDEVSEAPVAEVVPAEEEAVELPSELTEGERSLLVLFGSQSGNSEDLGVNTVKLAANAGLNATLKDMESASMDDISAASRVLIICSTWGEGEQPDNAEAFWQAASASSADLSGVSFSVCALGDSAYDLFCEAGKQWDTRLGELGARRVVDRADCDVDFDPVWKTWSTAALANLACIDESGNVHEDFIATFAELISPTKKAGAVSSAAGIVQADIDLTVKIFRYDPAEASRGWDSYDCTVPGHLSISGVLNSIRETQDGSISFRSSGKLSGLLVNGRVVRADECRVLDLVGGVKGSFYLNVEPLPGHEVLRDLIVATDTYDNRRSSAKVWARTRDRMGEYADNGIAIGTMEPAAALKLYQMSNISSLETAQAYSDALPYSPNYLGPAVCLSLWRRASDPRTSAAAVEDSMNRLEAKGGLWSETDISAITRQGADGATMAKALYQCRADLLRRNKFTGKHGKHVKWFSRTIKMTGEVNETLVPALVTGPIGMIANGRQVLRMLTGVTRTGGPLMRDKQALFLPPASIGKMPPMFSLPDQSHHQVVAIFNEFDKRF